MKPSWSCLKFDMQLAPLAFILALPKAGRSIPARIAMMAMTTSSSMSVNAALPKFREDRRWGVFFGVVWLGKADAVGVAVFSEASTRTGVSARGVGEKLGERVVKTL